MRVCSTPVLVLELIKDTCAKSEVEIRKDGHNAFLVLPDRGS
jgi:hypothetical protein